VPTDSQGEAEALERKLLEQYPWAIELLETDGKLELMEHTVLLVAGILSINDRCFLPSLNQQKLVK